MTGRRAGTDDGNPPARVLVLSSWVARGHVGLAAAAPALQALGCTVTQLPTVLLSNHPGWPHCSGEPVPPATLVAMIDALAANGWLADHDALLTGYLPSADHVALAAGLAARLRAEAPGLRIVVDPVLGDAPGGLYLPEAVAHALRTQLCPLADLLTPNLFELGWLAGRPVDSLQKAVDAAAALRSDWGSAGILVTSAPFGPDRTGVLSVAAGPARMVQTPRLDGVPHGVGDVFAALVAAGLTVGAAVGCLQALVGQSLGAGHLRIAETSRTWAAADALPSLPVPEGRP